MGKTGPGFRSLFRDDLRNWRDGIGHLRKVWDSRWTTRVYDETVVVGKYGSKVRPAAPEELPEHNPAKLRESAALMRRLATVMQRVAGVLEARADALDRGEVTLPCGCPVGVVRDEGHQEGCSVAPQDRGARAPH